MTTEKAKVQRLLARIGEADRKILTVSPDQVPRLNQKIQHYTAELHALGYDVRGNPRIRKPENGIPCLYDPPIEKHHIVEGLCVECSKVHSFHAGIDGVVKMIRAEAP